MTERRKKILLLDDNRGRSGLSAGLELVPEIRDQAGSARRYEERPRRTGKARQIPHILAPRHEKGLDTVCLHELSQPRDAVVFRSLFPFIILPLAVKTQ